MEFKFENLTLEQQNEIKKEYESILKKRPYRYFVKEINENTIKLTNTHREILGKFPTEFHMKKVWKMIPFKDYLKYLKIAINKKDNINGNIPLNKELNKYLIPKMFDIIKGHNDQTILTNKGYEISKKIYPDKFLTKIRKDLTVTPKAAKGYGKDPGSYKIYRETEDTIYIPRYYGQSILDYQKIPKKLSKGKDIKIKFNEEKKLRDYQIDIVKRLTNKLETIGGSILQIPCGFGKTCCALKMIEVFQKKTLVLIHAEHLLNQWKERIQEFLPNAKIGRIQGPIIDIEGKDIVIGMIQSVCKKEYKDSMFDEFGLVISDEAHRTGAKEFCKALRRSASYYTLGLTATPTRKDGLTKVFKWYLGDILDIKDMHHLFKKYTYDVTVKAIYYTSDLYEEKKLYTGGYNIANMTTQIIDEKNRNQLIVDMARQMVLEENRQVLIISHRIAHIRLMDKMIKEKNTLKEMVTTGFFIGGMKEDELIQTTTKNIIIGSFKMIEEGADIKTLDTIILTTPKGDVEQATGRIMRQKNPNKPLIIDFIDLFSIFVNQSYKRMSYYKKKDYNLVGYKDVIDDNIKAEKIVNRINDSNAFADDSD